MSSGIWAVGWASGKSGCECSRGSTLAFRRQNVRMFRARWRWARWPLRRVARRLTHPNIVKLYASYEAHSLGAFFLAHKFSRQKPERGKARSFATQRGARAPRAPQSWGAMPMSTCHRMMRTITWSWSSAKAGASTSTASIPVLRCCATRESLGFCHACFCMSCM